MAEVKLLNENQPQYPSNSRTNAAPAKVDREKIDAVVKDATMIKKPSFLERVRQSILPGDINDMKSYLIHQILIPGIQNGIISAIEIAFFKQARGRNINYSQQNRTNYSYVSTNQARQQSMSNRDRLVHDFQNIIFKSYQDAEDVIGVILELLDRNGAVTVADFYDCCNQPSTWADVDWGWRSFRKLESRATRDGYIIDMTPPIYLK